MREYYIPQALIQPVMLYHEPGSRMYMYLRLYIASYIKKIVSYKFFCESLIHVIGLLDTG